MHIGNFEIDAQTVVFIITTIWAILKWLGERNQLPVEIKGYVDMIGKDRIIKLMEDAAKWDNLNNKEKHELVLEELKQYGQEKFGIEIPDSYLNIIISYAYKFWRKW